MDHLLEDRCEVLGDLVLGLWGPMSPDVLGAVGHDNTSHGSANAINSVHAGEVRFVARGGRGRDGLVADSGMLRTIGSRYATRTWPGTCPGAKPERSGNRRPNSGCVGSVTSIAGAGAVSGVLKGVSRCSVFRHHRA